MTLAPADWRSLDEYSKQRLLARRRAEAILQGKHEQMVAEGLIKIDATPSAMARRLIGERWHQRAYHDVLDRMALDLRDGVVDMATLSIAPQVGKSTWVNWFVFWWQTIHPQDPIIRMSYAAELATTHARSVQQFMNDYGSEFGLLPKRGAQAQHNWETITGAGLRSGGMLTGVSGYPAALMILDDPLSGRAQAESKIIRERVWNEYSGSLVSRMRPGSPLLVVATRWHEDDPTARLHKLHGLESEGGRVRHINLAPFAEDNDPLGRAPGEPLPHPWIDPDDLDGARRHWEDKRRSSTLRDWFSLYMGDPKPAEGALLTEAQVKAATWMGELPQFVKTGVAIDQSGGGRDVAGVIGGGVTKDGVVIWTHDRSAAMKSEQWAREACLLAHEIDANVIIFEHNYGGDQSRLIIRTTWESLQRDGEIPDDKPCPRIEAVHAKKGKRVRAEPIAAQITFGKVMFWALKVLDLASEWQTWQEDSTESPGRIDASSYLAYKWIKVPGAESVVSSIADKPNLPTGKSKTAGRQIVRARPGL